MQYVVETEGKVFKFSEKAYRKWLAAGAAGTAATNKQAAIVDAGGKLCAVCDRKNVHEWGKYQFKQELSDFDYLMMKKRDRRRGLK